MYIDRVSETRLYDNIKGRTFQLRRKYIPILETQKSLVEKRNLQFKANYNLN